MSIALWALVLHQSFSQTCQSVSMVFNVYNFAQLTVTRLKAKSVNISTVYINDYEGLMFRFQKGWNSYIQIKISIGTFYRKPVNKSTFLQI